MSLMLGYWPQAQWAWEGAGSRPGNRVPWFQRVARCSRPYRKELGCLRPSPWPPFPLEVSGQGCLLSMRSGVGVELEPACNSSVFPRTLLPGLGTRGHDCRGLTEGLVSAEPPQAEPQTARLGPLPPLWAFSCVTPSSLFSPRSPNPAAPYHGHLSAYLDPCRPLSLWHLPPLRLHLPSGSPSATLTARLTQAAFWPRGLCTCCVVPRPGMPFQAVPPDPGVACFLPSSIPSGRCSNVIFSERPSLTCELPLPFWASFPS